MGLLIAEPPAAYHRHPPAIVDSSVLAAFIYMEPEAGEAEAVLRLHSLYAPSLLPLEIANVAMNKLRRGIASARDLEERLAGFDFSCITLRDVPPDEAFALAARYTLSAYDAAYLWLAGELGAPLLSFDARLVEAARDHLGRLPPAPV
ncbi:MAG: type II toxin-antitoxin system VapC family toxin [Pseudomonadota bacterium]